MPLPGSRLIAMPEMNNRRFFVGGNWKMNGSLALIKSMVHDHLEPCAKVNEVEVVIAPPAVYLSALLAELATVPHKMAVAAQNMHQAASGAFTGEISAGMLQEIGAEWVILGHSERRQLFAESVQVRL